MLKTFSDQARLLVAVLPHVAEEWCFALKGGTAINLFVRDMLRLSVDIDLAYLPVEDRDNSLAAIDKAMKRIEARISRAMPVMYIEKTRLAGTNYCIRLTITNGPNSVKIEVNPVLRGSVHQSQEMELSATAEREFGYARIQILSFEDLYGGKLCAALDRQHPRDLFDIKYLLENEGITEKIKNTFLVYLISHGRPIAELLDPGLQDIGSMYENEFNGMTREEVSLEDLYATRDRMIKTVIDMMNDNDRTFLLSLKDGKPQWDIFAYPKAAELPAVNWKLHNIGRMTEQKKKKALNKLEKVLTRQT